MKIIDLLNKLANGEEVPKHVQYYNMLKDKTDIMMVCKENIFYKLDKLEIQLNSRIEPVEEEKKIPEKLEYYDDSIAWVIDGIGQLSDVDKVIIDKLNDVIDYLKSKGE